MFYCDRSKYHIGDYHDTDDLLNGEDSTIAIVGEGHGIDQPVPYTHRIQSKHASAPFHTNTSTQHVGRVPCIGVQGECQFELGKRAMKVTVVMAPWVALCNDCADASNSMLANEPKYLPLRARKVLNEIS